MVRKGIAGLASAAATLAVLAFAPTVAVAHPCTTAAQSFLSLDGGVGTGGLPTMEEMDCTVFNDSGTIADTTTAAAADVPDAVSTYTWTDNLTPLGHHARNVPNPGPSVFNSDLAFQGNYAYQGHYDGFRIIDVSDPANPTQTVNVTNCGGTHGQGDVVVYGNILVRSWDAPVSAANAATAMCGGQLVGQGFEGIHIFDISNPAAPVMIRQLRMANTGNEAGAPPGCGSHTDTIVPDAARGNIYLYIGGSSGNCTGMDIVRINIADPTNAVYLRRAAASRQCHDNNVIMGNVNLAMCAGGNGLSVFSFDPALDPAAPGGLENPTLLYSKPITGVGVGHSGSFTYDGKVLVFGHEPGGGSQAQCQTTSSLVNRSIYFIEPRTGTELGTFQHQRPQTNRENCTWHNFNIVPTYRGYAYVSGNYQSGISVVDFTDPTAPREVAYADPAPLSASLPIVLGGDWSTYWHNGKIYESDIRRGLTTWALDNPQTNRHLDVNLSNPQTQTMTFDPDFVGPEIQIDSPVDGSEHAVNSVVQAGFGCTDSNSGVESCVGTVAGGAPVDTSTTGAHTFTVTATDKAGNVTTKTVTYHVLHTSVDGDVSGTVPGTLSLTIGNPASFGAFTPGVAKDYFASTTANVISTAGDAALTVADPSSTATGHLVNGTFSAPAALQARARNAANPATAYADVGSSASPLGLLSYAGPISNDAVALEFKQAIGAADPLRTGTYSKTLTFTLSTTTP